MNNCALRGGEDEDSCQMCRGTCPDRDKLIVVAVAKCRPATVEARNGDLDDGDEVSWTAGKETFCPVKFHAFDVGPVTVTSRVRPGETTGAALARVRAVANVAWSAEYLEKLAGHLARVREAAGIARNP